MVEVGGVGKGGLVQAAGGRGMKTADDSFPGSVSLPRSGRIRAQASRSDSYANTDLGQTDRGS